MVNLERFSPCRSFRLLQRILDTFFRKSEVILGYSVTVFIPCVKQADPLRLLHWEISQAVPSRYPSP
jgi:hypothetical protein